MTSSLLIGMLHGAGGSMEVSHAIDYAPYLGCEPFQVLEAITGADPRDIHLEENTLHLTERGQVCAQMHGPFLSRVLKTVDEAIRSRTSGSIKRTILRQKRVIERLRVIYGNKINPRYAAKYFQDASFMSRELRYLISSSKVHEELVPQIAFPSVPPLYKHLDMKLQHLSALIALHEFQNFTVNEARKEAYGFGLKESKMLEALSQLVYFGCVEVNIYPPLLTLKPMEWLRIRKHYDRFFREALSLPSLTWLDRQSSGANISKQDKVRKVVRLMLKEILETGRLPNRVTDTFVDAMSKSSALLQKDSSKSSLKKL